MAHAINTTSFANHLAATVLHAIEDVKTAVTKRALYKSTLRALSDLGDRELEDMGIRRYEIRDVAHRAAYGD